MPKDQRENPPSTSADAFRTPKPKGWRTAYELRRDYVGDRKSIIHRIEKLRQTLIADLTSAGYSSNEALCLVEDHLIGIKVCGAAAKGFAVSSDAERLLDLT